METMDQLQQPSSSSSPPPPLSTADRIECNRPASKKSLQSNVSLMLETLLTAVDEVNLPVQQQQQQNGSGEAVAFDIIAPAVTANGSTSDTDVQQQQNNTNAIEFEPTTKLRLNEQVDNLVNEVHNSVLVMVTGEGSDEGTRTGTNTNNKKTYRKWPRGPLAATPIIPNSNTRTYSKVTRVKNFVPPLPLLYYRSTSGTGQQQSRKSVIIETEPCLHSHSTSHHYDLTLEDDILVANLIPEVQIDVQEHDNVKMNADHDGDGDQNDDGQSACDDYAGGNDAEEMDQREGNSPILNNSDELVAIDDQQPIEQQQQPKQSTSTELTIPPGLAQRIEQAKAEQEKRELEEAAQARLKPQKARRSTRTRIVLVNPNVDNEEDDEKEEEEGEAMNEDDFFAEDEENPEEKDSSDGTEFQEPKGKRVLTKKKNQSEEKDENEVSTDDGGEESEGSEEPTAGPSTSQKQTRKASSTKAPRKPRKKNENATRTFYQCLHCEKQFKRKDYLDHHLLIHNGIHLHKCEYCERNFTTKAHLVDHRMTHTGEKRHQCQYCDQPFAKTFNYKRHLRLHLDLCPYICTWPGCQYRSGNRSDVIKHIRGRHLGLPRYLKDQKERNITDQRDARMYFQELKVDDPLQMAVNLNQQMNQHLDDDGDEDHDMVEADISEEMDQVPEPMEGHNQMQPQPNDVDPNLAQLQNGGGVPLIEPIDILATLVPDMQ